MFKKPNSRQLSLIFVILLGGAATIFLTILSNFAAKDFQTYYDTGSNILRGVAFIGTEAPMPNGPYVYLPLTAVLYIPFSILPKWTVAYPLLIGINALGGVVLARLAIKLIQERGVALSGTDIFLITGAILLSPISILNIAQTQPNLWLAAAVLAGYQYTTRGQSTIGGVLLAIPAVFKLWPALFGLWLLRRRDWRAIGSAITTGLTALATSVLLFGVDTHSRYFQYIIAERSWSSEFAGGLSPEFGLVTLRRPISVLAPGLNPGLMAIIGFALSGCVLAWFYTRETTTPTQSLAIYTATIIFVLIAFPSTSAYLVFAIAPVIILLYEIEDPRLRIPMASGFVAISMTFTAPDLVAIIGRLPLPDPLLSSINGLIMVLIGTVSVSLIGLLIVLAVLVTQFRSTTQPHIAVQPE